MPRTQKAFDSKVKELNTNSKPTRKTRSDKKPVYTKVKSTEKWELGNGNGNIGNTMPWYLHPVKKDTFNRSWFYDYDQACIQIKKLHLKPEQYTLWHLVKQHKNQSTKQKAT